jgi:predicted PurR-regulated permease PerM
MPHEDHGGRHGLRRCSHFDPTGDFASSFSVGLASSSVSHHVPEMIPDKPSPLSSDDIQGSALIAIMFGVVVVACLYFGREVLVPIALAVLMSFVLAPPVRLLQGWRFPRSLAVIIVAFVAFAAIFSLGGLMVAEVNQLASDLPRYQSTLREKIQSLRGATAVTGTLERASQVLQELNSELNRPSRRAPATAPLARPGMSPSEPVPVEIMQPTSGALQTLGVLIAPLIQPLTTTGIVVIFVIFILAQEQDLRNRLIRLAGSHDLQRTTAAIDDAGQRLSRLFLTQLALNAGFGLVTGAGLWIIGVPNAPLWGMLALILRFVPYIGPLISAIFPLILAAAVGPGWSMVLWTALLLLIVEPIAGQIIEPLVYGRSSGLSPVAVIASATFWTWLWGPIGLILATPLTICLVVLGRHVNRLRFLGVMFGDEPALTPAELVYQRMLARDPVEASEQARRFLKEKPLLAYYEEILLEGLKLAAVDAERGLLDPERTLRIRDAVAEIVDDLTDHEDSLEPAHEAVAEMEEHTPLAQINKDEESLRETAQELPEQGRTAKPVLCIPGLGLLDEAVALMLTQLVERRGVGARAEQADALSRSRVFTLDTKDVALVCLCYMENPTPAQIHYAIRRLRRKAPGAFILVTLLGATSAVDDRDVIPASANVDLVKASLGDTVERLVAVATSLSEAERLRSARREMLRHRLGSFTAGKKNQLIESIPGGDSLVVDAPVRGFSTRGTNGS